MTSRRALVAGAVASLALAAAGCGDDSTSSESTAAEFRPHATLSVWAPTSLEPAFSAYNSAAGLNVQASYAGADQLAAGIRGGELVDLYAADDPALTDGLFEDGLVQEPVAFATDDLVLAVPKDSKIKSLDDLTANGVKVAIGHEGLPSGDHARAALAGLPAADSKAILANVSSEEANNNGIVIKLTEGDADAGFVYATDVIATNGKLRAIELPADLQQEVVYTGAVVEGSQNPAGAQHYLDAMVDGKGAEQLEKAGYGPPPSG